MIKACGHVAGGSSGSNVVCRWRGTSDGSGSCDDVDGDEARNKGAQARTSWYVYASPLVYMTHTYTDKYIHTRDATHSEDMRQ